jgi:WD40 repeat protein
MIKQSTAGCFFLLLAAALSACESAATRGEVVTPTVESVSPPASLAAETAAATEIATPTIAPTPASVDPLPGLVYAMPDPKQGMIGPFLVESNGQSTQISDKPGPVLSPDRTQLLYSSNDDIWILDLTTSKTRNLTQTGHRVEQYYQWWPSHPDLIVFHYQMKKDPQPGAGYLASVKPDGTNYLLLDEEARSLTPAALSPDGQSIAYDRAGQPWVYHFGAGMMPIFPKSFTEFNIATNPAWSPDSRRIAWQLFGLPGAQDNNSALGILDLDGLLVTTLHSYDLLSESGIGPNHLAWSPDGNWLAVANPTELAPDGENSLWVIRPDGSAEHFIGSGDRPIWNPDGTILLYTTAEGIFAVKAGDWIPFQVMLPEGAQVTDWIKTE